jgi:hypothetical protein
MRLTKIMTAAALASLVAGSAIAGGFAQEVVEAPVVVVEPVAETSSWGIILPLAALGLLVALAASSDDGDEDATTDAE